MKPVCEVLVFGYKGRVVFAGTYEEVLRYDALAKAQGRSRLLTPLLESGFGFEQVVFDVLDPDPQYAYLKHAIQELYTNYGRFGDFGDVIRVLRLNNQYIVTTIAQKTFPKTALASDLVPFVVDDAGNCFVVAVRRGQDPGKGLPALMGGFQTVKGHHLVSSIACIIDESWEELGMKISVKDGYDLERLKTPFPKKVPVVVRIGDHVIKTVLLQIGPSYYTGSEENNVTTGYKRVGITTGYMTIIRLHGTYTAESLAQHFVPQDLVENNQVLVCTARKRIAFGLSHHNQIYADAYQMLQRLIG